MIVTGTLQTHASQKPDAPALIFDNESINWRELAALTTTHAAWLQRDTQPGESIALDLANGPAFAIWFLACLHAGREALIFDPQWPDAVFEGLLKALGPGLMISAQRRPCAPAQLFHETRKTFDDLARDNLAITGSAVAAPVGSNIFFTGFTSGSTALPKGYRRSHASWIASFKAEQAVFQFGANDCVLAPGALTHSLFLYAFARSLHAGMTCILARRFNPSRIAHAGVTHGARVLYAAPSQLLLYATQAQAEPALTWPDLRWVISSGARWPKDQKQQLRKLFPKARFGEFYGSSETSFVSYSIDGDETPEASSGKLFPGVDLRILDASGAEPGAKQSGRIAVRSAMTFDGYALNKNDATLKDDWVLTGDSGWRDENGYLFLDGRSNRMIVTSGKNLFPEEVETFLQRHPAIEQSAVLALADSRRGERLAACLKIRAGASCSRRELIAYLRLHLPLYKIPRLYFSVVDWPFTASQKTAFAQLQMQLQAGQYGALP